MRDMATANDTQPIPGTQAIISRMDAEAAGTHPPSMPPAEAGTGAAAKHLDRQKENRRRRVVQPSRARPSKLRKRVPGSNQAVRVRRSKSSPATGRFSNRQVRQRHRRADAIAAVI
jgi:hypothetical protein